MVPHRPQQGQSVYKQFPLDLERAGVQSLHTIERIVQHA
jgi:hypothetical protein